MKEKNEKKNKIKNPLKIIQIKRRTKMNKIVS